MGGFSVRITAGRPPPPRKPIRGWVMMRHGAPVAGPSRIHLTHGSTPHPSLPRAHQLRKLLRQPAGHHCGTPPPPSGQNNTLVRATQGVSTDFLEDGHGARPASKPEPPTRVFPLRGVHNGGGTRRWHAGTASSCLYANLCMHSAQHRNRLTSASATFGTVELGGSIFWWSMQINIFWGRGGGGMSTRCHTAVHSAELMCTTRAHPLASPSAPAGAGQRRPSQSNRT